jgi:hypothetical protein
VLALHVGVLSFSQRKMKLIRQLAGLNQGDGADLTQDSGSLLTIHHPALHDEDAPARVGDLHPEARTAGREVRFTFLGGPGQGPDERFGEGR